VFRFSLTVTVSVAFAMTASLTACSDPSASTVTAAPDAADPACAIAIAAAPATVADLARTPLSVPGALSWGEPAVILRCGLPAQAPTTKPCLGVNGVDWVVDAVQAENEPFVFVSYGRTPAVELRVPASYGRDNAVAAVTDVGPVAAALPSNGRSCVGPADSAPSAPTATGTSPAPPDGVSASRSGG
jgi:hypothetical protein